MKSKKISVSRTRKFKVPVTHDGKFFVKVTVKPSQRTLVKDWNIGKGKDGKLGVENETLCAFFRPYCVYRWKNGKAMKTGEIGEMVFNAENLTADTIAHECGHVAHAFCRRKRKTDFKCVAHEEIYCWALGTVVDGTMRWFLGHGYEFRE